MCKKHEEPGLGKNNPYFPGLREAIFHGRFPSEIPQSRLFLSPHRKLGKSGGVKSPHTCAFVIFGLLTRWLAGSEWVMGSKMGSRTAWIGRPGRKSGLMLRKLGKKGATALFIITEQRHRLNGAQRPIVAAKLNRFENFFAHTAPTLHYQIYASSTLYLHLDARERFQLARQFFSLCPSLQIRNNDFSVKQKTDSLQTRWENLLM